MRVITGDFKGRLLKAPKGRDIRPTADKVKEALFSMIGGYIEDAVVVDLFAGSGALGLEALSRGARICYFCDNAPESLKLISANIGICGAGRRSAVLAGDFEKTLLILPEKADIILLDPPYKKEFAERCLMMISEHKRLKERGVIVFEHGADELLPDEAAGFIKIKEKKYGAIRLSLYS